MRRIAIVGNGPSALSGQCGHLIDSCEVVVRFNRFKVTDEWSTQIGTKTTVWAVNYELVLRDLDQTWPGPGLRPYTMVYAPLVVRNWYHWDKCWNDVGNWPESTYLCPRWVAELTQRYFDGTDLFPSTGFMAVIHYAMNAEPGDEVFIHGFDHFREQKHHYCDDEQFRMVHDARAEATTVQNFINAGLVEKLS